MGTQNFVPLLLQEKRSRSVLYIPSIKFFLTMLNQGRQFLVKTELLHCLGQHLFFDMVLLLIVESQL